MPELQIVLFTLNNELCGVNTALINQILKCENIKAIKDGPDYLLGSINVRGKIQPVIDLNKRFNLGDTTLTNKTKILITEIEGYEIGFTVNDVSALVKLSVGDIENIPELAHNNNNSYVKTVAKKDNKIISIIDLVDILNEDELVCVFKLTNSNDEVAAF